jgi:hypothetical protein
VLSRKVAALAAVGAITLERVVQWRTRMNNDSAREICKDRAATTLARLSQLAAVSDGKSLI